MIFPERYFKTSAILLDACKNETLFHTNWDSCACANIIAAHMGYTLRIFFYNQGCVGAHWRYKGGVVESRDWGKLVQPWTILYRGYLRCKWGRKKYQLEKEHLACTGYTRKQLRMIARSFDQMQDAADSTTHVVDGLKRVLGTLRKIHKVDHFDVQHIYRKQFAEEHKKLEQLPQVYESVEHEAERHRKNQLEIFEKTGAIFGEILPGTLLAKKEKKRKATAPSGVLELSYE